MGIVEGKPIESGRGCEEVGVVYVTGGVDWAALVEGAGLEKGLGKRRGLVKGRGYGKWAWPEE